MSSCKESIWKNIFRRFIGSFSSVFGFFIALFLFFGIANFLMKSSSQSLDEYLPMKVHINQMGKIEPLSSNSSIILQININGPIGPTKNGENTSAMVRKILMQPTLYGIAKDRIKAILLHINSPGGSASDSDEIYTQLMEYKKLHNIPVHAWIGDMCASGGYYIASAADHISSQAVSIIGSVGVRSKPNFNFYQLMQKIGVEQRTVTAGKDKIHFPMFSPLPKGTASYDDIIAIINQLYKRFVSIVVEARKSKGLTEKLLIQYGARVYSASDAKKLGYIDQSSVSLSSATKELAKVANISEENYQVISFSRQKGLINSQQNRIKGIENFFSDEGCHPPFSLEMQ